MRLEELTEMRQDTADLYSGKTQPTLFVPIGVSGSGKSTLFKKLKSENPYLEKWSLDDLRHQWYDPKDYNKAWQAANADKGFMNRAQDTFRDLVHAYVDIYVDNTNLSPRTRKYYIDYAKSKGYKAIAYTFDVDLNTLIKRQTTRGDKNVPEQAVRQQFASAKPPQPGEFDEVIPA